MFRKLLFGALAALVLAGGMLMTSAMPGETAPIPTMSAIPHAQVDNNVIQVKACGPWNNWCGNGNQCGPWNNWCGNGGGGGGGSSGCVIIGGVKLCIGGGGPNCHWYNGVKYCNNQPSPPPGQCIVVNGKSYCSYKYNPPCVYVNGVKYCRH